MQIIWKNCGISLGRIVVNTILLDIHKNYIVTNNSRVYAVISIFQRSLCGGAANPHLIAFSLSPYSLQQQCCGFYIARLLSILSLTNTLCSISEQLRVHNGFLTGSCCHFTIPSVAHLYPILSIFSSRDGNVVFVGLPLFRTARGC